jgi:threonine aldolase
MKIVDFRSDTVTCPGDEMRKVIFEASVGDAGYDDDPSVNELESLAAELVGQEAALFVSSGIMGNIVSTLTHCRRGEAILVGDKAHIYRYEGGGFSAITGVLPYVLDDETGVPSPESVKDACPIRNVHFAQPSLLCLENTHNDRGGLAVSPVEFQKTVEMGRDMGLAVHLDGARIFNAAAAWDVDVKEYTASVDSVQFCLSKGLGAPMGALLCGSEEFISRAKFARKMVGGELRQAGFMAAAGIYALKKNVDRLVKDHENASIAEGLLSSAGLIVESVPEGTRATNMIYFHLPESGPDGEELSRRCLEKGVLLNAMEPRRIRLVTHLDMDEKDLRRGVEAVLEEVNNS